MDVVTNYFYHIKYFKKGAKITKNSQKKCRSYFVYKYLLFKTTE